MSSTYFFCPSLNPLYFSFPAEAEGTQAQGVCSQRGLKVMEGPAQTGQGSQTPAPACTAATGYSEVSGRRAYLCVSVAVCVCIMRPGQGPEGLECVTSSQCFLDVMDASTDVRALSCPRWAAGEVNITCTHILADTLREYEKEEEEV